MKRSIAMLLALLMVFSLSVSAFASTVSDDEKGSITITGVGTETVYEIYKLLDLESYDTTSGAYSYKVNADWTGFFASEDAAPYFTVDAQTYATWIGGESEDAVAAFAKLALAYAKANDIDAVKSTSITDDADIAYGTSEGKTTLTFSNLELGYYLVDSTMGALCGLTTTNPNAYINAKNAVPTIDKQVEEDSTEQWADANTADIGQIIKFRVTINVHAGAENYVLHDTMSEGLTFDPSSVKVEHVEPGVGTHTATADKYAVKTGEDVTDGCTFEVRFTKEFCDSLETNDKVVITYSAMLNRNAIIAEEGNTNNAKLEFGEGGESNSDTTVTKTYGFDLVKTDSQNQLLDGAQFRVYDAAADGNEVPVVILDAVQYVAETHDDPTDDDVEYLVDDNGQPIKHDFNNDGVLASDELVYRVNTYRRARADETGISIVVTDGKVRVVGFDNGTYYLQETVTPAGYNSLAARQRFIISDENLDATINGNVVSTGSGVHVVNKSGTMLPETGGMGTVMFLTFGMFVVLGTGVLLVTKKRMTMIVE